MDATNQQPLISFPAFLKGLGVVVLIYAALTGYVISISSKTIMEMEGQLSSDIFHIKYEAPKKMDPIDITENLDISTHETEQSATVEKSPKIKRIAGKFPLAVAPIAGVYTETPEGLFPTIRADGLTPFDAYRRPYTLTGRPVISFVAVDYGFSEENTEWLLKKMPSDISLLVSPYLNNAQEWVNTARDHGHEVWLKIPFEQKGYPRSDPGPLAIITTESLRNNRANLKTAMTKITGYSGIAAYYDDGFEEAREMLKSILREAFDGTGLAYYEINPDAEIDAKQVTENLKVPYMKTNFYAIPEALSLSALEGLASQAKQKGYVVVPFSLTPQNIKLLIEWFEILPLEGLSLAPLSAINNLKRY